MDIDITARDYKTVTTLLTAFLPDTVVWAFGSRVKFTAKPESDLDLVAFVQPGQESQLAELRDALTESDLPFKVDLLDWNKIPENFKGQIKINYKDFRHQTIFDRSTPKKWKSALLGDLVKINSKSIDRNFKSDTINYIDTSSVTQNRFSNFQRLKTFEAPSRAKRIVKDNDIIYSTVRPIQRHYGIIKNVKPNTIVSTGFAVLTPEKIDAQFLYYYLTREEILTYLNGVAESSTTTFPAFNPSLFETLEISFPESIIEQQSIASILSSLDDKIELNQQMNQTLETIAQTIFKEWFVNFNFPGFDGELVDGLPKGWRVRTLGEIADIKGGSTPSTAVSEFWNGEFYWTTPKDLSNLKFPVLLNTERKITAEGVEQISSGILPKGTLLLSSRAPVGYLAITQVPVSINQGYIAMNGKSISNIFILYWLKINMNKVEGMANGSTFQEISKSNFRNIAINIPDSDTLKVLDSMIIPLFERIVANEVENSNLALIRDSLLPKLMTGKLRVSA